MRKKQANTTELQRTPIKVTLLQGDTIFRHARQFHGQFKIPISTSKVQFQNYSSFEKLVRKKKDEMSIDTSQIFECLGL